MIGATSQMLFFPPPSLQASCFAVNEIGFVCAFTAFRRFAPFSRPRQDRRGSSCPVGRHDTEHLPVE